MISRRKPAATLSLVIAAFLAMCPLAYRGETAVRSQKGNALLTLRASSIDAVGAPSRSSDAERARRTDGVRSSDGAASAQLWARPNAHQRLDFDLGETSEIVRPIRSTGTSPDTGPRIARAPPALAVEA